MVSLLLTCATTWVSLLAVWCLLGANHRGQPWMPALTLPHVRYGLRVRLMAVLCTFRRPSMCRPVQRQLMRNESLDLTTILPATACHQRNYVETYSRSKGTASNCPESAITSDDPSRPESNKEERDYLRAERTGRMLVEVVEASP